MTTPAHLVLVEAGQGGDVTVAEGSPLGRHQQAVADVAPLLAHAMLQVSEALHLGDEPGSDAGDPLQLRRGDAATQQRQHAPEP